MTFNGQIWENLGSKFKERSQLFLGLNGIEYDFRKEWVGTEKGSLTEGGKLMEYNLQRSGRI